MKYKIVSELYHEGLQLSVQKSIEEGWQPVGGVCCAGETKLYKRTFLQTMTKS